MNKIKIYKSLYINMKDKQYFKDKAIKIFK